MSVLSLALSCALTCVVASGSSARAFTSGGIEALTFGAQVDNLPNAATGEKPENKLFYTHDGDGGVTWWAVLGLAIDPGYGTYSTPGVYLWRYTRIADTGNDSDFRWQPQLELTPSDPWNKADTLFDQSSGTLLVSLRDNKAVTGNPRISYLHRLTYDGAGGWTEVGFASTSGQPIVITKANPETVTIVRDTAGKIWTSFEKKTAIKVGYLLPGKAAFRYFTISAANVKADDISEVVSFGTGTAGGTTTPRVGVLWSDQVADRFWFAWRNDTDPVGAASFTAHVSAIYGNGVNGCPASNVSASCADDHLHMTVAGDTIYATVKTSLNDADPALNPDDPLIVMSVGTAASDGVAWTASTISTVQADFTRPIVVVQPASGADPGSVYVFATELLRDTYYWHVTLPITPTSFDGLAPAGWTVSPSCPIDNATSTRQPVDASTGVIAMAASANKGASSCLHEYWYNVIGYPPAA
ncbi:MAG: hypothetical protein ACXVWF_00265 [Actinomycetota bacterium]